MIGWREWVALPDLGVESIKVKVDTGAQTSSLHAEDISISRKGSGERARFKVYPIQHSKRVVVEATAAIVDYRKVKSSTGHSEKRPVIKTVIAIMGEKWPIEITLTRRDEMGFRMLLGRQAIRGNFVVDPGHSYLGGRK